MPERSTSSTTTGSPGMTSLNTSSRGCPTSSATGCPVHDASRGAMSAMSGPLSEWTARSNSGARDTGSLDVSDCGCKVIALSIMLDAQPQGLCLSAYTVCPEMLSIKTPAGALGVAHDQMR